MRFDQLIPNRILRWSLWAGFWTVIALINFGSALIGMRRIEPDIPAWQPLVWELSSAYVIGLVLVPLVRRVTLRLEFKRDRWVRILLAHLAFTVPFSLLHTSGMVAIRKAAYWINGYSYDYAGANLARAVLYEYYQDVLTYWIIVLVTIGFEYFNRYRERERQLAEAQLQNLREQLNPHFLFNTLNMISSKMYEDVAQADAMIARLSDLLRMTLRTSRQPEVPLRTDLEALDLYLEIMRARFGDAIQVDLNVDAHAHEALAPSLILQPLVENAFRHGVSGMVGTGRIRIGVSVLDHTLTMRVSDNGPGFQDSREATLNRGFGLSNTAARLQQLYGDQHRLDLGNSAGGGAEVVIRIPYRVA
ncbi:MAG TPA: histidine kinase [Terriglobia bacterium]|nr:histidine kinase [Terriglobia bacterium]